VRVDAVIAFFPIKRQLVGRAQAAAAAQRPSTDGLLLRNMQSKAASKPTSSLLSLS